MLFRSAIILVFANRFLQERLDGITAKNSSQIEVSQQINSQITAINQKINSTDKIQQNFKTWSKFITTVSNLRNNNTSYQSLAINYQNSLLEISGQSATREDLLAFKDNLDKSGLFTDIDLPITDLLPKEKNVFHIKATINLSKIK